MSVKLTESLKMLLTQKRLNLTLAAGRETNQHNVHQMRVFREHTTSSEDRKNYSVQLMFPLNHYPIRIWITRLPPPLTPLSLSSPPSSSLEFFVTATPESESLCDWRFTLSQFVWTASLLRLTTNNYVFN